MTRVPRDTIFEEDLPDALALPSPGDVVSVRCQVTIEADDPDRALAIFADADGDEVAVCDKTAVFEPDAHGRLGVRGTVLGLIASGDAMRLRLSLARPDGLTLEDGRAEVEVALDLLDR